MELYPFNLKRLSEASKHPGLQKEVGNLGCLGWAGIICMNNCEYRLFEILLGKRHKTVYTNLENVRGQGLAGIILLLLYTVE